MKHALPAALAVIALLLAQPPARADLDPANLHLNGPGGFAQGSGGVDWITLPGFTGEFNITDVANNGEVVSPWHLVIAIPNVTGGLLDNITRFGSVTGLSIGNDGETSLSAGQDAYARLGVPGNGLPNSLSFTNFSLADTTLGLPAPSVFGMFDFTLSPSNLAIVANGIPDDVMLSGTLPAGSILFAWGLDQNGTTISTAFTNAGVVSPLSTAVPEPSTMAIALVGGSAGIAYGLRRRRRTTA